jgi:hypothetical protein
VKKSITTLFRITELDDRGDDVNPFAATHPNSTPRISQSQFFCDVGKAI